MSPRSNKPLYAQLREIEKASANRDLTDTEFERITEIQDQIDANDIVGVDGNDPLGEMHPHHTGTISKAQFDKLNKKNL